MRLIVLVESIELFGVDALVHVVFLVVVLTVLARGRLDPRVHSFLFLSPLLLIELVHLGGLTKTYIFIINELILFSRILRGVLHSVRM